MFSPTCISPSSSERFYQFEDDIPSSIKHAKHECQHADEGRREALAHARHFSRARLDQARCPRRSPSAPELEESRNIHVSYQYSNWYADREEVHDEHVE